MIEIHKLVFGFCMMLFFMEGLVIGYIIFKVRQHLKKHEQRRQAKYRLLSDSVRQ